MNILTNCSIIRTPVHHIPALGAYRTYDGAKIILQIKRQHKRSHKDNHGSISDEIALWEFVKAASEQAQAEPTLIYTKVHHLVVAECWHTTDRIMIRFKKPGTELYEDMELWTFVKLVLDTLYLSRVA